MSSHARVFLLIAFVICCVAPVCHADSSRLSCTIDSITAADTTHHSWLSFDSVRGTKLERLAYVAGASLAFSLFDYIGYNWVRVNNQAPLSYRVLQTSVQLGLTYFLVKQCGFPSAFSFNLIWWTWGDDIAYNGWADLINPRLQPGSEWENRDHNGLHDNQITWAYWTPIGLLRTPNSRIPRDVLIPQAIVGFSIAVAIL